MMNERNISVLFSSKFDNGYCSMLLLVDERDYVFSMKF
jgi:hypothetical protein